MKKWELKHMVLSNIVLSEPKSLIRETQAQATHLDGWEKIQKISSEGWELVNVIEVPGLSKVCFLFKRELFE